MSSPYFTADDCAALTSTPAQTVPVVYDKMVELHHALYRRMRDHQWDLHPYWERQPFLIGRSAASSAPFTGVSLPYSRSKEHAARVERLMGRDGAGSPVEITRHPVIELRLTPEHLSVELILAPAAWWDQRNLVGKLSIPRHRAALRTLLQRMLTDNDDLRVGFWEGIHLSDYHLTTRQLLRGTVLDEWMSTFGDGQDWLRIGAWYPTDHANLTTDAILRDLTGRISALHQLYAFFVWTSNNNFHNFYPGAAALNSRNETRM